MSNDNIPQNTPLRLVRDKQPPAPAIAKPMDPRDLPLLADLPEKCCFDRAPHVVLVPPEKHGGPCWSGYAMRHWPGVIMIRAATDDLDAEPGSTTWARIRNTYLHEAAHTLLHAASDDYQGGHDLRFFAVLMSLVRRADDWWGPDRVCQGWHILNGYDFQDDLIDEPVWFRWKMAEEWSGDLYDRDDLSAEQIARIICGLANELTASYPNGWDWGTDPVPNRSVVSEAEDRGWREGYDDAWREVYWALRLLVGGVFIAAGAILLH